MEGANPRLFAWLWLALPIISKRAAAGCCHPCCNFSIVRNMKGNINRCLLQQPILHHTHEWTYYGVVLNVALLF